MNNRAKSRANNADSIKIEIDAESLSRLFANKLLSVEEIRLVDKDAKHQLKNLFLELLNRELQGKLNSNKFHCLGTES